MIRLAIVSSHPIQYNAPLFKLLAADNRFTIRVFYTLGEMGKKEKYDPGFGKTIQWDIPLTEGYDHTFVNNIALQPGTGHFKGIVNPTLINDILAWNPSSLLVYGWSFTSHLKCLRYFHNKLPVFFRGDSTLLDETTGIKKILRRLFLRWVYGYVDKALFVGENNRKYFLAHGLPANRLVYAPHAVDNKRFSEEANYSQKAQELRLQLGCDNEDTVLLFAGKLEPKKNPFFLAEVLKRVTDKRLKIIFTGNGVLEQDLKQTLKNDHRAIFLDFQNQQTMPVLYRVADMYVLPSSGPGETWGLAVNEAMACGVAVAASDKTGCAVDLIKENVNGFLIRNNDPLPFCDFIRSVLADKSVLKKMGNAGSAIIADYSFEKIADALYMAAQPGNKN